MHESGKFKIASRKLAPVEKSRFQRDPAASGAKNSVFGIQYTEKI